MALLRHPFLLLLIVLAGAGWYLREDLKPWFGDLGQLIERYVPQKAGVAPPVAVAPTPAPTLESPPVAGDGAVTAAAETAGSEGTPVTITDSGAAPVDTASAPVALPETPAIAPEATAPAEAAVATEPPASPTVPTATASGDPALAGKSTEDLWYDARKAYWYGDVQTAEQYYREAALRSDANPEILGELGNVLAALGRKDEALDVWERCIAGLAGGGRVDEARALIEALAEIDAERARALTQRLGG